MDESGIFTMNEDMYENFIEQDFEEDYFDVTFNVQGKKLYAYSSALAYHSCVFKTQFIENRSKRNKPIQIDDYTYDEFKEFIRFFYLSTYNYYEIDTTHTHAVIELADIYEVDHIKKLFAGHYEFNVDHIFEDIVFAHKHELECDISSEYLSQLTELNEFSKLDISDIKVIVDMALDSDDNSDEDIYKAVYKWGEHQAMVNDEMTNDEKNELIFHYIKNILLRIKLDFKEVTNNFVFEFAVPKGLISIEEANKYANIKITIESGDKTISGIFIDSYGIFEFIEYDEYGVECIKFYDDGRRCTWNKKFKITTQPSFVEKMKGCDWYLVFDEKRKLNVTHQSLIKKTDYLLAEMKPEIESSFIIDKNHNVYATVSREN